MNKYDVTYKHYKGMLMAIMESIKISMYVLLRMCAFDYL